MIPRWVKNQNGLYLNDLIRYAKGGIITTSQDRTPVVVAAAPSATIPSQAPAVIIEAPPDSTCELFSAMGEHDAGVDPDVAARMSVLITDTAYRRRLMNRQIPVNHVFGIGGAQSDNNVVGSAPFFLRESLLLEPQQTMSMDFFNNSMAGATAFRFAFEMRQFQSTVLSRKQVSDYLYAEKKRKTLLQPYWLTSDQSIRLASGGAGIAFFSNTRASYFIWLGTIATFIPNAGGGAGDTVEGFTVQMFDAKTERPLQNQPVVRSCCCGSAAFPFMNATGLIMEPNTRMQWNLANLITGPSVDVFITLVGVLAYDLPNPFEAHRIGVAEPSAASIGVP